MTDKPHSLSLAHLRDARSKEEKFKALGPIAARHGQFPKGTVLPETQVPACRRVRIADFPEDFLPKKYTEALEQNQLLNLCCRHTENHEIEARKSHPEEEAPDIYIIYCTECGRKHIRFCVGITDDRPIWE